MVTTLCWDLGLLLGPPYVNGISHHHVISFLIRVPWANHDNMWPKCLTHLVHLSMNQSVRVHKMLSSDDWSIPGTMTHMVEVDTHTDIYIYMLGPDSWIYIAVTRVNSSTTVVYSCQWAKPSCCFSVSRPQQDGRAMYSIKHCQTGN